STRGSPGLVRPSGRRAPTTGLGARRRTPPRMARQVRHDHRRLLVRCPAWPGDDPGQGRMPQWSVITLRPAAPHDASFLAEMLFEAVNWHSERRMSMAQIMAAPELAHYVAGWPRPGDGGVIALADRRPIGAAWWRIFPEDDPGYGFVSADVPDL